MPRHMTMIEAAQGLLMRVTRENLDANLRRTPAGFIQRYLIRWQFLAGASGVPGELKTESALREQYIAIRQLLHRFGYSYPEDNEPGDRFDKLTRAAMQLLGKGTKSEILWNQILERRPCYLDAFVLVNQWAWNVADARAERNNLSWEERSNRMREQQLIRLQKSLDAVDDEIRMNRTRIAQLNLVVEQLTQERNSLTRELEQAYSDTDSSPSPISRADSGNNCGPAPVLAGESIAFLDRFGG